LFCRVELYTWFLIMITDGDSCSFTANQCSMPNRTLDDATYREVNAQAFQKWPRRVVTYRVNKKFSYMGTLATSGSKTSNQLYSDLQLTFEQFRSALFWYMTDRMAVIL